jgi:putative transposase
MLYPSSLTYEEWRIAEQQFAAARKSKAGRPIVGGLRPILDAISYVVRTGCQWRQLPHDFGPWTKVYAHFRRMRLRGTLDIVLDRLREAARMAKGKSPSPTVAVIDSQSVKTAQQGGLQRGYDAGKKIKGRKRHIAVDTLGLLLAVVVHSAGIQDRDGAKALLIRLFKSFPSITMIFADSGYTGKLIGWCLAMFGWVLKIVKRTEQHVFRVLPKRWIVERTFAWLGFSRRLSKDYEVVPSNSESMVKLAMIRLLIRRLA